MSTKVKITITEALAEIKLIEKKLDSKTLFVSTNLCRVAHVADQLGNSQRVIAEEVQSIKDLMSRIVGIRKAIADANVSSLLAVDDSTMSIQEWLTWKREVAKKELDFFNKIHVNVKRELDKIIASPQAYKDADGNAKFIEVIPNLDYKEFVEKAQKTQHKLDKLDGMLSLKNATILIEI